MFGELAFWEVATPLFAVLLGALLSRYYDRRPKVLTWILHAGQVNLKNQEGEKHSVRTHVLVLRNAGKKPAENVRISHNNLPQFSVFPSIEHEIIRDDEGAGGIIMIPRMLPNETININYLYFPPVHVGEIHAQIRHNEGFATDVRIVPNRQYPGWVNALIGGLMIVGLTTAIYFVLQLGILVFELVALVR
ncbi:MAG: hypothetical protein AAGA89_03815 [Pseudomonadota bacterium]